MTGSDINNDLLNKIEQMDDEQARGFYGLLLNYLASMADEEAQDWDDRSMSRREPMENYVADPGNE